MKPGYQHVRRVNRRAWKRRIAAAVLGACLGAGPAITVADEVAQVPLIVTSNVPPNIMYVMDDSGSMHWETIPDELTQDTMGGNTTLRRVLYVYPAADLVYGEVDGAGDYWSRSDQVDENIHNVPGFGDGGDFPAVDRWAAYFRSAHNNAMYYDPAIRYQPWVHADGSAFPDADPEAALHNPVDAGKGARDLTSMNTQEACWIHPDEPQNPGNANRELCNDYGGSTTKSFYPATYFRFTGDDSDDVLDPANYEHVEIRDDGSTYAGGPNRTDCADPDACTYEEEIQNFANWYTYHRSRILAARGGIGRAFAAMGENVRVGYSTILAASDTIDGESSPGTIVDGVRSFTGANREAFYEALYERPIPIFQTPLRRALDDAGQYYSRADERGPWNETPGEAGGEDLECRNSYTVLMTDGYWTEGSSHEARTSDARQNVDGIQGPLIEHPDPEQADFQYQPEPPFEDDVSNTLADVAMHYWNRDLRPDLDNRVPVTPANEAFWQHMVTFGVGLGVAGTLDPENDLPDLATGDLDWPDPFGSDAAKIDDLWHAAVNSRGEFFSANDPELFAEGLSGVLGDLVARTEGSAASVAANSTRLDTGTRIYQARFNSTNWSGHLVAFDVNMDGSVGDAVWDAADQIPQHAQREIFTWDGNAGEGTRFEWNWLNGDQRALIDPDAADAGATSSDIMDWLRGDDSNELRNGGPLRNRALLPNGDSNVLGDIVNSDPFLVGQDDFNNSILPGNEGEDYLDFRSTSLYQNRPEVLYVGANAGMQHAIDAESGEELFAFVPDDVIPNLRDLSGQDYSHRFYVDGKPRAIDAYIDVGSGTEWRTVLVGSTGAGGQTVFALDVTDPENFSADDVLWEFTDENMGYTIGQPTIARLHNGDWVALFGNGYDSDSHTAQLIMLDLATGEHVNGSPFDTGAGDADDPNGLSSPLPIDTTGDRITEHVYAGDLHGNLWRFDFDSGNTSQWEIAYGGDPVFTAVASDGRRQPITARPEVGRHPDGGFAVFFGTGQLFREGDNIVDEDPVVQSFYGIQDNGATVDRGNLQQQEIIVEFTGGSGFEFRVTTDESVDAGQQGWFLELNYPGTPAEGELVVENALLRSDRIIFVTTIPSIDPCDFGGAGWLMELSAFTGSRLEYAVFDVDGDGAIDDGDAYEMDDGTLVHVTGRKSQDVITAPTVLDTGGGTEFKYMSAASGEIVVVEEAASGQNLGRQSWRQLR